MKLYSNKTHWYVFAVLLTIAAVVACENNVTTQSPKETGSEIAASKTNSPTVQAKGASGTIKDEYIVAFKERWQNV